MFLPWSQHFLYYGKVMTGGLMNQYLVLGFGLSYLGIYGYPDEDSSQ